MASLDILIPNGTRNSSWSNRSFSRIPPPHPHLLGQQELEVLRLANIAILIVISVLSVLGNTSLLAVILTNRSMRTATNYLIVNMAVSDLSYVVFVAIPLLQLMICNSTKILIPGVVGNIVCKLIPFVRDVSFAVSILSMVAIALDRFFAVVYPLRQKPFYLKAKFVIPLIWVEAIATFAIYFYIYRLVGSVCIERWPTQYTPNIIYFFLLACYFFLPLTIITVIYSVIIHHLKHQNIPGNQTSVAEDLRRRRNRSITKLGVFIVVWFFIAWAPHHTLSLLRRNLWTGRQPINVIKFLFYAVNITTLLSITSVASNPFVCYACSTNFRKYFAVTFLRRCCRSSNRTQSGQTTLTSANGNNTGLRTDQSGQTASTVTVARVDSIELRTRSSQIGDRTEIGISNAALEDKTIGNSTSDDIKQEN